MNKRRLYDSIMESISKEVKRALNETFLPSNNYTLNLNDPLDPNKKEYKPKFK